MSRIFDNLFVEGNVGVYTQTPTAKLHVAQESPLFVGNLFTASDSALSFEYFKIDTLVNGAANITASLYDSTFLVNIGGSIGKFKLDQGNGNTFETDKPGGNAFIYTAGSNVGSSLEAGVLINYSAAFTSPYGWDVCANRIDVGSTGTETGIINGLLVRQNNFLNTAATFYPGIFLDGNVGIGTPTPLNTLQVGGTGGTGTMNMNGGGGLGSTLSVRGHATSGYQFDMYTKDFSRAFFLAQTTGTGPGTNGELQMMFVSGNGAAITAYDVDGKFRVGFGGHYIGDGALLNTRHDFASTGTDALFSWTDTQNYIQIDSIVKGALAEPYLEMAGGIGVGSVASGTFRISTTQNSYFGVPLVGTVGNLGVGTSTPGFKLDVVGAINTDNGFWHNGHRLLQSDTVDYGNVFVGSYGFDATPGNTGTSVSALGYNAAQSNTGDNVIGIGNSSALGNTGSNITGIGTQSAQGNSGNNVIAIGYQSAIANTGNNIIALGAFAADTNAINDAVIIGKSRAAANAFLEMWVGVGPNKDGTEAMHPHTIRQGSIASGVTDTGMTGVDLILAGAVGTGTGVGGKIKFQVAPAGTTGSTQNALIDAAIIDQDGHIGINTAPVSSYFMKIDSATGVANGLLVNNDWDRAIVGQVITNPGLIAIQGIANTGGTGVGVQGLTSNGFGIYGSASTGVAAYGYASGAGIAGQFEVNDASALIFKGIGIGGTERFRVTEKGDWGIGLISPTAKVHIQGSDTTSSNFAIKVDSSTANILTVRNDHTLLFSGISSGFTGSQKYEKQDGTQTTSKPLTKTISTISTASNQMVIVKGTVAGFRSTFAESYGSTFFAVFYNNGGTLTQVSTTDLSEKHNFAGLPAPTTTVTTSGTDIIIQVTGVSGTTINWVSSYEYSAVNTNA